VDIYLGGDKIPDVNLTLTDVELSLKPQEGNEIKFRYSQVIQCKFMYNLHVDELPDDQYKNKVHDSNYVPVAEAVPQTDCCIFFKLLNEVDTETGKQTLVDNTFICSQDNTRCMYKALIIGKEIETGCLEEVNTTIADGVLINPQSTIASVTTSASANKNPPGYKWVDDQGWVDIEFDNKRNEDLKQFDFNFCADA